MISNERIEILQNRFHARCGTCNRRLKEKIEMTGTVNRDNACDFKWHKRLQCICKDKPSIICLPDMDGSYDRSPLSAAKKFLVYLRESRPEIWHVEPGRNYNYSPVNFESINDHVRDLDMNRLIGEVVSTKLKDSLIAEFENLAKQVEKAVDTVMKEAEPIKQALNQAPEVIGQAAGNLGHALEHAAENPPELVQQVQNIIPHFKL